MKFNKKYCLLFLMTVLVLLLGAGMVSASEAGDNVEVVKDNNGLSTPANYDVDKVVQSDYTKSDANVEKTSTKYDKDLSDTKNSTFVNQTNDNPNYSSQNGHSVAIVEDSTLDDKLIDIAYPSVNGLMRESADVIQFSTSPVVTRDLTSSENMTPIFTEVAINNDSNKVIAKITQDNVKSADEDLPEAVKLHIKVIWNNEKDTEDFYSTIRYSDTYLIRNGNALGYDRISSSDNWEDMFYMPKYDNSNNEYQYSFEPYRLICGNTLYYDTYYTNNVYLLYDVDISESTDEYEEEVDGTLTKVTEHSYVITHTFVPPMMDLNISKVWRDGNNSKNIRPETLVVDVNQSSVPYGSYELNSENNWTVVIKNLPTFNYTSGRAISYTVKEIKPEGYSSSVETSMVRTDEVESGHIKYYKFDNFIPQNITVNATWDDADNRDGLRPYAVRVNLYKNGEFNRTSWLLDQNNWNISFNNLPIYDEDGNEIVYTITESTNDCYISNITQEGNNFTINYTYVSKITMNITKTWNDSDDYEGFRPSQVQVKILANGEQYGDLITITADDNWTCQVSKLPKYMNGELITYTIEEIVPEMYNESHTMVKKVETKQKTKVRVECTNVTDTVNLRIYAVNLTNDFVDSGEIIVKDTEGNTIASGDLSDGYLTVAWDISKDVNLVVDYKGNDNYYSNVTSFNESEIFIRYDDTVIGSLPWYMSDNLWAYCIMRGKPQPDMAYAYDVDGNPLYMPHGKYALTNETIISSRTNEDVLQYIRTLLFYHARDSVNFTISNAGMAVHVNDPIAYVFLEHTGYGDGRYSQVHYEDPSTYTYAVLNSKEEKAMYDVYQKVQNGDVIANHGTIETAGGKIAYQFYRYHPLLSNAWQDLISMELTFIPDETEYIVNITNTHIPQKVNITVTKNWKDNSNQDGIRPTEINVTLYANGEVNTTVTINGTNTSNTWTYKFENLDKYSNGKEIVYTVNESSISGYDTSIGSVNGGFVINNTHVPELINISVKKIWDDNDNQDGLRPDGSVLDSLLVYLYKNNKSYRSCKLSDSNNWTYTFINQPKYEKGVLINYTVVEKNQKYVNGRLINYDLYGYTAEINREGDNFTITNTHIPELTNVSVVKVWNDSDDVDGLRPENISVVLNANGEEVQEAVLNSENNWNCTFVNLPVYKDGVKIRYAVEELDIPEGYQFGVSINEYNITLTNTHIQENITINVTKIWNDTDDKDGSRPENITIQLLANGEVSQTAILNSSMNWTYSFTNLTVYKDGQKVNYTINEIVPEGYNVTYGEIVPVKVDTNITLGLLNITKTDDTTGTARFLVTVRDQYNEYVNKGSIIVTDSKGNLITEEELDNGMKYINVPVKFDASKSPYGTNNTVPGMEFDVVVKYEENDLYSGSTAILTNITDKFVVAVVERNASAEGPAVPSAPWKFTDGEWVYCADPAIPDYNDTNINDPDQWINNTLVPYIKVEVNNETILNGYLPYEKYGVPFDEKSLEYYKVLLYYFGEELDPNKYPHEEYPGLQEIMQILTGYWTRLEENYFFPNGNYYPAGWYIINGTGHGIPDLETGTGKPLSYYVNKTMELVESGITVPNQGVRNVTTDGRWEYKFNIYYPYQYYFGETTYQRTFGLEYTFIAGQHDLVTNITNSHIPEKVNLTVNKFWNDSNNQDGLRKGKIYVDIYKNDEYYDTIFVTSDMNWTTNIILDKYTDGIMNNYTINEVAVDGYDTVIANITGNYMGLYENVEYNFTNITFNVNNTHIPENTTVNVTKIWDDSENVAGFRPNNITINLIANGKVNQTVKVNSTNWNYTFENLPKYHNGTLINYTVTENSVANYNTSIVFCEGIFKVINSHIPEKVSVNITKVWNDSDNNDGIRPTYVEVALYENNARVANTTVSLYEGNNWTYTYKDLPKYKNGKLVNYIADEVNIPEGYTSRRTGSGYNYTVTNTHKLNTTRVEGYKIWSDRSNNDNIKPNNVTIQLYADGVEYGNPLVLSKSLTSNFWSFSFTNLPKYNNTKLINYTVKELNVPEGYIAEYSEFKNSTKTQLNITNVHDLIQTEYTVSKVWNDSDDNDGVRPDKVYVQLYGDGYKEGGVVELNELNDWKYTFKNLTKYYNKREIVYTVEEVNGPFDYVATYDNGTITNTHEPLKINITVNKVWNDSDDKDGLRPENITVTLNADGVAYESVILSEENNWTYTFINLAKYVNKTRVNYTLTETVPKMYNVTYGDIVPVKDKKQTQIRLELLNITRNAEDNSTGSANFNVVVRDQYGSLVTEGNVVIKDVEGNVIVNKTLVDGLTVINLPVTFDPNGTPFPKPTDVNPGVNVNISIIYEETDNYLGSQAVITNLTEFCRALVVSRSTMYQYGEPATPWYFSDGVWGYCTDPQVTIYMLPGIEYRDTVRYNPDMLASGIPMPYIRVTLTNDTIIRDPVLEKFVTYDPDAVQHIKNALFNYEEYLNIMDDEDDDYVQALVHVLNGYYKYMEYAIIYPNGISENGTLYNGSGFGYEISNRTYSFYPDYEIEPNVFLSHFVNETMAQVDSGNITPNHGVKEVTQDGRIEYQFYVYNPYNYYFGIHMWQRTVGIDYYYVPDPTNFVTNITNTHIVENVTINVTKQWNDTDDQDGVRPNNITVTLYVNGEENQTVQINDTNDWTYTFKDLPVYLNGALVNYTIAEEEVANYTTSIVVDASEATKVDGLNVTVVANNTNITLINTHETEKVSVNVSKVWDDANNTDGIRPSEVLVQLYKNETGNLIKIGEPVALYDANNWTYVFDNLDKYCNGTLINYTVDEVIVPAGYSKNVTNMSYVFTINNTHITENTTVNVTKIWDDANNTDGKRPDSVNITLVIDGKISNNTVQINGTNWTYTFENLPKYRDNGTLIEYNVTEERVENYNTTIVFCEGIFKVINSHITENTSVNVTKVWTDNENQDGIRPDNVTVKLLQNGNEYRAIVLNASNDWKYTFTNLPKYYDEGKEYEYSIVEIAVPGYSSVVTNVSAEFTVNNTHITENTTVNVSKVWDDMNNNDAMQPANVTVHLYANGTEINTTVLSAENEWKDSFTNLPKYSNGNEIVYTVSEDEVENYTSTLVNCNGTYKFINTHVPEVVNKTVYKQWNDSDNQDDMRPTQVTIRLKSSDGKTYVAVMEGVGNRWNYTFTDLPKYSNGTELVYTVEETVVPNGYTVEYDDDTLSITNTHELLTKEINVTKVWEDNENNDNVRPTEVQVDLYADGVFNKSATLKGDDWTYTFTNLTVYKAGEVGVEIVYTIKEHEVANYTSVVSNVGDNFTVTNTHNDSKVNLTINKVWEDSNDNDHIRPANVTVRLLADGEEYKVVVVSGNDWTYTFTDLPEYNNKTKVVYTIEEVNVPAGYTASVDGLTITNTHENITKEINVTKVWDDNNDNDNARTSVVVVELLADGVKVNETTLSADNDWKATFTNLPVNKDGNAIVYNISEVSVDHYTTNITECCGNFVITNTLVPELVNVTVNKVWNDSDNQDDIRPSEVTLKLKADGQEYIVKVVKAEGNKWTYTFTDLPKFNAGNEIVYTVEEVNIATGYNVTYSEDTLSIVNTHVPDVTEINVTKVWDDNNNNDNARTSVVVDLIADGEVIDSTTLSADNGWKATFSNLPVNKDGKAIVYNISEVTVDHYTSSITENNGNYIITNTLVPELVNVTVNKVWNDSDNQDGLRPSEVTLKLKADGQEYIVKVVKAEGNTWTYTFTDLPKFNAGKEIVYTVEEVNIATGYNVTYSEDTLSIVNTHVPMETEVNVTKVWNDADNNDGKRPDSVTVDLIADGEVIDSTTLSADNDWKATFSNLPVNKGGKAIVYTIGESEVPTGYTVKVVNCEGIFKVVNTYVPENTSISVSKVWEDADNQDGVRPDSVTVKVLANGKVVQTATITEADGWTYTFMNLPKYSEGQEIVYTVEEVVPAGYNVTVNGNEIINTHIPEVTEVDVAKVWNDADNQDGKRPGSVTVDLLADGVKINETTLDADNDWKATFSNLPVNKGGKAIVYTINESNVPTGYTVKVVNCEGIFKVVNSYVPENTNVSVSKVWIDMNDQDGIRPDSITVKVLADGVVVQTATVNGTGNTWTYTFTNLPKYSNGQEIVYTVDEVVPKGYTSIVLGNRIINAHIVETTNVSVVKVWNDADNNDGKRPVSVTVDLLADGVKVDSAVLSADNDWKATFDNLPVNKGGKAIVYTIGESEVPTGYTVKVVNCEGMFKVVNSYVPENTSISVSKVWEDADNQDAIRPNAIFVQILANGEKYQLVKLSEDNDWKETITNLPKYSEGQEIVYTIVESEVPAGYTAVVDGLTITNTHIPEVTTVNVTKVWSDNDNNDGVRPGSVTVYLYADGVEVDSIVLSADNDWRATFENLPVNKGGKAIKYTVSEANIENYTSEVVECCGNFNVINTHIDSTVDINITKVWVDDENRDGIRPDTVSVRVLADGEEYMIVVVEAGADWMVTVTDLPEYNNGNKVVYSVEEVEVPAGYTAVVDGLTITNTHEIITTQVNVSKVWNDNDNNDGVRPDSVTVYLYANGEVINSAELSEDNGWGGAFIDLPVYENGEEIVYTIGEVEIANYTSTVVNCNGTYKVINTHIDSTVEINITKVWEDADNQDGIRPNNVTIEVLADGQQYGIIVLEGSNNWKYTVTNLPEYKEGKKVVYTVREINVANGYTSVADGLTITNTHIPDITNVSVVKVWNDSDNNDGKRPDSVTVELLANGKTVDTVVLDASNSWKHTFTDLAKYADGQEIVYTIGEENVPAEYTAKVVNCEGIFKVINTYIPENTSISVSKVWNDTNNQDGVRPDSVTVKVLAGGKVVQTVVISEADGWTYTFTNLPKYSEGQEIVYTVEEVVPADYNVTYNGNEIINTHIPDVKDINVTKVWNDSDNNDAKRPDSVTVYLYADGTEVNSAVLSADNDWKATFENLPVNKDGKAIFYTVNESKVDDYTSKIINCCGNYTIINTHENSTINLTINKVWEDSNDNDGLRPENITIILYADDNEYDTVVVKAGENWTYKFENLPEYNNGNKVVYTVEEVEVPSGYNVTVDGTTIINTHENITKNISVSKVWNDSDDNDGVRPDSVTVVLLADGVEVDSVVLSADNDWKATFENLPVNKNGKAIVYNISEISVENYTSETKECCGNYTIINTHEIIVKNISVEKIWNDQDNNDGVRPDNVTVHLVVGDETVDTIILNADNGWKHTFENLPAYNDGVEIVYNITEDTVSEYETEITGSGDNFFVVNTHNGIKINITGKKVWNDSDNNDGLRPESVSVRLLADGAEYAVAVVSGDDWTYEFINLPKYNKGHEIIYTVEEVEVPEGYTVSINGTDIINTHEIILKNISVSKVWNDSNNNDGMRPDSVSVQLLADGTEMGNPILLSSNNSWKHTFENLQVYNKGHEIKYTVKESAVDNYTCEVQGNDTDIVLVNTHENDTVNLTLNKVWDDLDNNYTKRPENITVNIYADGNYVKSVILSQDNGWNTVVYNLTKFNNSKLIKYTVNESKVKYYNTTITSNDEYNFTITNTLKIVKRTCVWAWKLIGINETYYIEVEGDYNYTRIVPKAVVKNKASAIGKTRGIGKYSPRHSYPNRYSKQSSWKPYQGKHSYRRMMSREKYRLFIFLCKKCFFGNMSYADFVAILKANGIDPVMSNAWNSSGILTFDYDDLEEVPDSIELHDNGGHVQDSSDNVEKHKAPSSSGVIDEGKIELEVVDIEE